MATWTKPLKQKTDATAGQSRTCRGGLLVTLVSGALLTLVIVWTLAPVLAIVLAAVWVAEAVAELAR